MRIGLLTFHDTTNFGSWLQTYALYRKVKQLGHKIEIINYKAEGIEYREKLSLEKAKMMPIENIFSQLKKQMYFWIYMHRYMDLSKKYTRTNIYKAKNKYDLYLLGSDLVWDLNITYEDKTYLFDFLDDEVRCAYAASSGRDYIPDSQRDIFRTHLKRFQHIAVREYGMKEDIEDLCGYSVQHVCDPTLLFDMGEWSGFITKRLIEEKYILIYIVDGKGNLSRLAKKYAREHGLKLVAIHKDFNTSKDDVVTPFSIKDFLSLIFYAEKVFTASYHGMMFSLIFNKQFAFYPYAPETRMISVAEMFELQNQNIESNKFDLESTINYESINMKLNHFRNESIEFLRGILVQKS